MVVAVSAATLAIVLSALASTALMENQIRRQREEELRIQNQRFDMALASHTEFQRSWTDRGTSVDPLTGELRTASGVC